MGRYIVKRILLAILAVPIICAITFFVMNAIPSGPFNREKALSAATIEALNRRYNLDKPVPEQFLLYMKNLLHGDFGVSLKNGRNITEIIAESFPISAKLGLMAIAVALLCGTVFGSFAALMRNKLPDRIIVFFSTLFTAVPSFVLATLLLLVFCIRLAWFPVWDPQPPIPSSGHRAFGLSDGVSRDFQVQHAGRFEPGLSARQRQRALPSGRSSSSTRCETLCFRSLRTPVRRLPTSSRARWSLRPFFRRRHRQQVCRAINRDYTMIMATTIFLATLMVGEPDLRSFVQRS